MLNIKCCPRGGGFLYLYLRFFCFCIYHFTSFRHDGYFHVSWNNSPYNEDQDGQRSMYSSSADGRTWSEPIDIFPSMPASRFGCTTAKSADADADADEWSPPFCYDKIHQHSMPYATLNGRLYAVSTIRRHQEGAFFYPQPADDLNATLLRRVLYPGQQTAGGCAVGKDAREGQCIAVLCSVFFLFFF